MPTRAIHQDHGMSFRADIFADLIKMFLHGLGVGVRHDKRCSDIALRADGAKNIAGGITLILWLARARASFCPLIDQSIFLPHPYFVLKPDFNDGVRFQMLCCFGQQASEVFYILQWLAHPVWDAVVAG